MTDDLPEIVVPNDEIAVRAQPPTVAERALERGGLPSGRLWIVGTDADGSVFVVEIPEPDDAVMDVQCGYEEVRSWERATTHFMRTLTTATWTIVTTRPWTMKWWPRGTWRPT